MPLLTEKEKLEKLNAFIKQLDGLTKEEFLAYFEKIIDFVKQIKRENEEKMRIFFLNAETLKNQLLNENKKNISSLNELLKKEFLKSLNEINLKFNELKDKIETKMANIKDGKDADEEKIIKNVLSRIELPKQENQSDTAEMIRNKLELLQGEEKLDLKAIRGLEEKLEEIKEMKGKLGRAVGPSVIVPRPLVNISTDSTPAITGAVNGTNKDFKLPKTPAKDRGGNHAICVFLNGVRLREGSDNDFTIAGKTLTFNDAPLENDIITIDLYY
jgi:hypothetical protein